MKRTITDRVQRKLAQRDRVPIYFRSPPVLKTRVQDKASKMRPPPTLEDILIAGMEQFLDEGLPRIAQVQARKK